MPVNSLIMNFNVKISLLGLDEITDVSNLTNLSPRHSTEDVLSPIGLTQAILCGRLAPGTPCPGRLHMFLDVHNDLRMYSVLLTSLRHFSVIALWPGLTGLPHPVTRQDVLNDLLLIPSRLR